MSGEILRSIRQEERKGKPASAVAKKAEAIAAFEAGDVRQARRAAQLARYLGASWVEIAWALGDVSCATEIEAHQWTKDLFAGRGK